MMTLEEDRKKIIGLQKELMDRVLEYQILYGSGSVRWNGKNYAKLKLKGRDSHD